MLATTPALAIMDDHKSLARRVREVRVDCLGVDGGPAMAGLVGVPARTWANFEHGVTMPAPTLLRFIAATSANPTWLVTGVGPRYLPDGAAGS